MMKIRSFDLSKILKSHVTCTQMIKVMDFVSELSLVKFTLTMKKILIKLTDTKVAAWFKNSDG